MEILSKLSTDQLMNILPENLPIYKDSGAWNIYDGDQFKEELFHQEINENLKEFLIRAISELRKSEYNESIEYDICLCSSHRSHCL